MSSYPVFLHSLMSQAKIMMGDRVVDPQKLRIRLEDLRMGYPDFLKEQFDKVVNEEIIQPIRDKMLADGISRKIAERTYLARKDFGLKIVYHIVSDFKTVNGFPVAVMIEGGRKGFYLEPVRAEALSWITKAGERVFSMGHDIPEYKPRRYVENMIAQKQPIVKKKIEEKTAGYIRTVMSDVVLA